MGVQRACFECVLAGIVLWPACCLRVAHRCSIALCACADVRVAARLASERCSLAASGRSRRDSERGAAADRSEQPSTLLSPALRRTDGQGEAGAKRTRPCEDANALRRCDRSPLRWRAPSRRPMRTPRAVTLPSTALDDPTAISSEVRCFGRRPRGMLSLAA